MRKIRRILVLLLAVAVLTTVVGCGKSQPTPKVEEGESKGPKWGGTLVIAMKYEPKFWNTNYDFDGGAPYVNMNVYSKLLNYNYVDYKLHGDLAETWDVSPDGKTYIFHLRKNVKWHDGRPFTAADVKWTMESIIAEGDKAQSYKFLKDVVEVLTPDEYTVKVSLKQPVAVFPMGLASYYGFNILPRHLYEGTDVRQNEYNWKPVGTGPFKLIEHVPGSHITMEANRDYFGEGPYLNKLIVRFIPNLPTAMAALESAEVGYNASSPPFGEVERIKKIPGISIDAHGSDIVQWFGFNFERKEYQDVRVRKAIAMAIDTKALAEKVYCGLVKPAVNPYSTKIDWACNKDAQQPGYDPEMAEKLLDEAGYKRGADGIRFKTRYVVFQASIWGAPEMAQVIKQMLGKVGIDVTIETLEFALFNEKIRNKRDFDLTSSGGPRGPDPSEFANFVGSGGNRNVMPYKNARIDELFDIALRTGDQNERQKCYFEIQEILAQEAPLVNLVEYSYLRPYRTEYHDFWWQPVAAEKRIGQDMYNLVWWDGGSQDRPK